MPLQRSTLPPTLVWSFWIPASRGRLRHWYGKGFFLEDAVNATLEELKADGTLQSIVDKYITAE